MTARDVSAHLRCTVQATTEIEAQITVAQLPGLVLHDTLTITTASGPVAPVKIVGPHGTRVHRFSADVGPVVLDYRARIDEPADPVPMSISDRSIYLRPSRYAECDKFYGFAAGQFGIGRDPAVLLGEVTDFVTQRLSYIPGTSDPIDGAADTLLAGAGVCRDYAHLVVALLRALTIPARVVAVYAPGCAPMDFHAVAEALIDDQWVVVDATGLAPRQSLVRIATGRDAADTAFLDNHGGSLLLDSYTVSAEVAGDLPVDDRATRVRLR